MLSNSTCLLKTFVDLLLTYITITSKYRLVKNIFISFTYSYFYLKTYNIEINKKVF